MTPDVAMDLERELTEAERRIDLLAQRQIDREARREAVAIRKELHAMRLKLARRVEEMQYAA